MKRRSFLKKLVQAAVAAPAISFLMHQEPRRERAPEPEPEPEPTLLAWETANPNDVLEDIKRQIEAIKAQTNEQKTPIYVLPPDVTARWL